jgi:hypothetical protein
MAKADEMTGQRICRAYFATAHTHPDMPSRYAGMWGAPGIPSQWARNRDGRIDDFLTREAAVAAASVCLCAALNRARNGAKTVVVRSQPRREAQITADKVFSAFK